MPQDGILSKCVEELFGLLIRLDSARITPVFPCVDGRDVWMVSVACVCLLRRRRDGGRKVAGT